MTLSLNSSALDICASEAVTTENLQLNCELRNFGLPAPLIRAQTAACLIMWSLTLVPGPLTTTALCLLLLLLGVWAWRRWRFLHGLRDAGVPGPSPGFFGGNVMEFRYGEKPPHLVVHDWLKRYGNIVSFHMGVHRYTVVNDLDLLQDIFIKDFKNFATRPPPSISTDDFRNSVLQVGQARWKPMRSLMVSCFTAFKMKQMSPLVSHCIDTTLDVIGETAARGEDVDIHGLFQALTCDVIAACALAMKANCQRDPQDPFLHRVRFFMDHASNPITESAFAFPLIADVFGLLLKMFTVSEKMVMMINENLTEVMRRRRENPKACPQDILQAMLDASEEQDKNGNGGDKGKNGNGGDKNKNGNGGDKNKIQMTDQEVKSNALVLVLAGYETTANALVFTAYLLAKHPHVQERLYEEIVEHLPVRG